MHRLFRHPGAGVDIRSGPFDAENYPGIDCKGDRNMSIVPPSRTRKGVYRWLNRRRIAAAPKWLMAMVQEKERAPRESDPFARFANWVQLKPVDMAELTLATAMIPNTLKTTREEWVRVGLALWSATGGSEEGYQLFAAWSRRWPGYNASKTRKFWDTVKKLPDEITAGTIFHLAEKAVPDWRERMYHEPKVIALIDEFLVLMGDNDE